MYIVDTETVIPSKYTQYMDGWLMLCQLNMCGSGDAEGRLQTPGSLQCRGCLSLLQGKKEKWPVFNTILGNSSYNVRKPQLLSTYVTLNRTTFTTSGASGTGRDELRIELFCLFDHVSLYVRTSVFFEQFQSYIHRSRV